MSVRIVSSVNALCCPATTRATETRGRASPDYSVRRETAAVYSGCKTHPATGSLQPEAVGVAEKEFGYRSIPMSKGP